MNSQHRVSHATRSPCVKCKGKEIEPSTRGDRDYKSKVNSLVTPSDTLPRRRLFQLILKVAASFFTRVRAQKRDDLRTRMHRNRENRKEERRNVERHAYDSPGRPFHKTRIYLARGEQNMTRRGQ